MTSDTTKRSLYVAQLGSGATINLLPLAAGQLVSRLKLSPLVSDRCTIEEILFRRPEEPEAFAAALKPPLVIGFSCYLWNMNVSLAAAAATKRRFPEALVVVGGPSIPKEPELIGEFMAEHGYLDVVCISEGEEAFTQLCERVVTGTPLDDVTGIIYREPDSGTLRRTPVNTVAILDRLPSPFLDGTFDDFYPKYREEFSGIIWETNRGCPFRCTFCTWGNQPLRKIVEKPWEMVVAEIDWIGRHGVGYLAMTDANFGIRRRDVEIARELVRCRERHGVPRFVSVSWAKDTAKHVLEIARILREGKIGFRITKALQSHNPAALEASRRTNIHPRVFRELKAAYYREHYYTYTELILGLPEESYASFMEGIERSLSDSVYEQLYVYPLFLFPNTEMATGESRARFGIESRRVPLRYTKCRVLDADRRFEETVEMVIGTRSMPPRQWVESFTDGYYTLALHDNRLGFFILQYLKREHGVPITDLVRAVVRIAERDGLEAINRSVARLRHCAEAVADEARAHLIEPHGYGGIPYDPPDGVFLETLLEREPYFAQFEQAVERHLEEAGVACDRDLLADLFRFQAAVIAHPDGPLHETLRLSYDWIDYFSFAFHLGETSLKATERELRIIDRRPSDGDPLRFLKNHYDVRGVPPFFELEDPHGQVVFPSVPMKVGY